MGLKPNTNQKNVKHSLIIATPSTSQSSLLLTSPKSHKPKSRHINSMKGHEFQSKMAPWIWEWVLVTSPWHVPHVTKVLKIVSGTLGMPKSTCPSTTSDTLSTSLSSSRWFVNSVLMSFFNTKSLKNTESRCSDWRKTILLDWPCSKRYSSRHLKTSYVLIAKSSTQWFKKSLKLQEKSK